MKWILAALSIAVLVTGAARVGAGQLGPQIPSNCVAHVTFDNGPDYVDDYRCAGLAIEYHTAGVAFSPGPIWAGQWLFVDEAHQFRVGSCVFNRGIHPTIDVPSAVVAQSFPLDPTGAKGAYLTWRYGDTTDNLTAAAMWAVMHYYAQDGAGTRRAANGAAPLVPSLDVVAMASGRNDMQDLAIALDAEATRMAGPWAIAATVGIDGSITASVTAGGQPVAGVTVALLMSGADEPATVTTDADGVARSTMPVVAGTMTVVASTAVPGAALVYRGTPAGPDPQGAQRLVTGGTPTVVSATATVDVPAPTTTTTTASTTTTVPETTTTTTTTLPETTTTTTTTLPETTTTSTSTTTLPETTTTTSTTLPPETIPETIPSTVPDTTESTTTTTESTTTTTESTTAPVPVDVEQLPPPPPPPPRPPLPKTGKGSDVVSYAATALLVSGIGVVGVASRRPRRRVPLHSMR